MSKENTLVGRAVDALRAAGMSQRAADVQLEWSRCREAARLAHENSEERWCGTCAYRVGELQCALPLDECIACQPAPALGKWAPDSVLCFKRRVHAEAAKPSSWALRYALAAGMSGAGGLYMIRELKPGAGRAFLRAAQACTEALLAIENAVAMEGEGR